MERSISALTFKGSISDAIIEAQRQKKLFVVYISGEDDDSIILERSTWVDSKVAESTSQQCIFLNLTQGSIGASQFSAIYPQKTVPSISAIGNNGVMIWQHEGFISAEDFVENIGKAWATLKLQETTAALLAAALASKKSEPSSSSAVASYEKGNSSGTNDPSNSDKLLQDSEDMCLTNSGLIEQGSGETISEPIHSGDAKDNRDKKESEDLLCPVTKDVDDSDIASTICKGENDSSTTIECPRVNESETIITAESVGRISVACGSSHSDSKMIAVEVEERNKNVKAEELTESSNAINSDAKSSGKSPVDCDSEFSKGKTKIMSNEVERSPKNEMVEELTGSSKVMKSNDVHLNIRLPNGTSLQTKLSLNDTLRLVKIYVDESQEQGSDSYALAVPYPRKLFNGEDMNKTLSELGFTNREALIVVPHRHATVFQTSQPSSRDNPNIGSDSNLNDNSGGYFGYVKTILSYMNPFSYLRGTASSSSYEPVPNDDLSQHRQSPGHENYPSAARASSHLYPPNERTHPTGDNSSKARKATSSRFGSNIHTLGDAEGEGPSDDRNLFWNGNSTQFGGDDKK